MFSITEPGPYRTGTLLFSTCADSQGISGLLKLIQEQWSIHRCCFRKIVLLIEKRVQLELSKTISSRTRYIQIHIIARFFHYRIRFFEYRMSTHVIRILDRGKCRVCGYLKICNIFRYFVKSTISSVIVSYLLALNLAIT